MPLMINRAGIGNIVFATGSATGAPLGGYLADTVGWRWSFGLQVPLALLAIIAVSVSLKLPKTHSQDLLAKLKRIDFAGAAALVSAVFCLLLGLDRGGNVAWRDRTTILAMSAFGVLFAVFLLVELRLAREPFAPKRIIVNPSLLASYLANFFSLGAGITQVFMITLYFQAVQGRTAAEAGLVLLPSILAGVLGSLLSGLAMQATGKYYWLTVGVFSAMLLGHIAVPLFSGVVTYFYVGIIIGTCVIFRYVACPYGAWCLCVQDYVWDQSAPVSHRFVVQRTRLTIGPIGAGTTTTLIALIANAGPEDQAIATAGTPPVNPVS